MVGVTPGQPNSLQRPIRSRIWLISRFSSMRSPVHSSKASCPPCFLAFGMGMKYDDGRRPSTTSSVIPSSSKRKCLAGASNGAFRIGFSMTICGRAMPPAG